MAERPHNIDVEGAGKRGRIVRVVCHVQLQKEQLAPGVQSGNRDTKSEVQLLRAVRVEVESVSGTDAEIKFQIEINPDLYIAIHLETESRYADIEINRMI